jgi:aromatic ring-cleaving dioxygenase
MDEDAPYHAHIYFEMHERPAAEMLRDIFIGAPGTLFVGAMTEGKTGPHPIPQFEVHFRARSLDMVERMIEASGLRALVHPLTDDDMADHTSLAHWIGQPVELDLTTLDPPGMNQSVSRFGIEDL